jgi:RimK family alpha-L-glutamate ligase
MKKILLIGIGEESSSKQQIIPTLNKTNIPHIYAKWSELSFFKKDVYIGKNKLNLRKINSVIFDIFRFPIIKKTSGVEIPFNLENEYSVLLDILKDKNIYTPNSKFFQQYPFYNKFSQMHIFASRKIPAIPTIHFCDNKKERVFYFLKNQGFHFPLVAKESYGGGGSSVWKLKNEKELAAFIENRRNTNTIFQPYVKNEADYRALVVGGKCLGIMKRSAQNGQWKNNYSLGGHVEKYSNSKMSRFAVGVCKKMGLELAGLDILSTSNGFLIIEVNLFFGLDGFQSVYPKINVAEKIIQLISLNI